MTQQACKPPQLRIQRDVPASTLTTLGVGGKCREFVEIHDLSEFIKTYRQADEQGEKILIIGEGSNLLFSDSGFPGRVIRNRICGRDRSGTEVELGGGENLSDVIRWLNQQGLSGMQHMFGIPGTVAGALVGNAGAYGQEIGDVITGTDAWKAGNLKSFSKKMLQLRYRHSVFKTDPGWFIVKCRLKLRESREDLQSISEDILGQRVVRYPVGMKCPGSFFKNVMLSELSEEARRRVPDTFVIKDKIPAGKLLEAVGARGASRGNAHFADYHGNLIINRGGATAEEILALARHFAGRVFEEFRIHLEPEIRIVDDSEWPRLRRVRAEE